MEKIKLSEKLSLSRVIQGFWRLESWNFTTDELVKFMNECVDRGVTTFDTAEIYSATLVETLMGKAFAADPALRDKIELVSKCGIYQVPVEGKVFGYYDTRKERVLQSCQESLKRLHTDHLDLYLIHREDPCFDPYSTAEALLTLKEQGLVKEIGVSNFDPFKFDALQKAVGGQLVTNQIEWNPMCFEHFNSGMMDYLTVNRIHPMIWSPLAGGNLFAGSDERSAKAMKVISRLAEKYGVEPAVIVYAWIMYHPVGAMPLVGSSKLDRLDLAIRALDVKLEHNEWYQIYVASGQQVLR